MSVLLEHEADPNLVDINGNTALHLAARIPSLPVALKLLEHEANINAQNKVKIQHGFYQDFPVSIQFSFIYPTQQVRDTFQLVDPSGTMKLYPHKPTAVRPRRTAFFMMRSQYAKGLGFKQIYNIHLGIR